MYVENVSGRVVEKDDKSILGGSFDLCDSIIEIKILCCDTSKVENMECMFYKCSSLTKLSGMDKWNTEKVTDMSYVFSGCSKLTTLLDMSKWNTNNVLDVSGIDRTDVFLRLD